MKFGDLPSFVRLGAKGLADTWRTRGGLLPQKAPGAFDATGILSSMNDDDYLGLAFPDGLCGVSATICHVTSRRPASPSGGLVACFAYSWHRQTFDPMRRRLTSAKSIKAFHYVHAVRAFD
jgi:hypothetical protein